MNISLFNRLFVTFHQNMRIFLGEYRSDEDNSSQQQYDGDNSKSNHHVDENSQQAVEAMLMMGNFGAPEPTSSKGL